MNPLLKPYCIPVVKILEAERPSTILDAPCGDGWLRKNLQFECTVDGVDLYAPRPEHYRSFSQADLNAGLPDDLGLYNAIVCCEGIEHLGNPDLFFSTARSHLTTNGVLIITTPNTWYPAARMQYMLRGFYPSFPCLVGKIEPGSHMHIMPWTFPQIYLYLKRYHFSDIRLHEVDEKKPKHYSEWLIGMPLLLYCKRKQKKAANREELGFWEQAGSRQSAYGRRLVVSARVED